MVNGFGADDVQELEQIVTNIQAEAVLLLLSQNDLLPSFVISSFTFPDLPFSSRCLVQSQIRVIGFHGQTVRHAPHLRITTQLADGALMAE